MISQKARYAFKALFALSRANPGTTLQTREIAEVEGIPRAFLEQILLDLKRNRLVESRRGKEGGYRLAKSPEDIHFGEVLRLIDGPIAPLSCLSRHSYRRCEDCKDEAACALRAAFAEAFDVSLRILEATTLAQALQKAETMGEPVGYGANAYSGAFI
jgi:Rrf2 family protein